MGVSLSEIAQIKHDVMDIGKPEMNDEIYVIEEGSYSQSKKSKTMTETEKCVYQFEGLLLQARVLFLVSFLKLIRD